MEDTNPRSAADAGGTLLDGGSIDRDDVTTLEVADVARLDSRVAEIAGADLTDSELTA